MPRPADPRAHDALLEAARSEFARQGLEHARVEDIARRAGLSKGAFYLHFRTKQDAFREILQRFLGAIEEHARARHEAEERLRREPTGVAVVLDFECKADSELLEIMWRNRQIVAAFDTAGGKELGRMVNDFRRRMRELVSSRIEERQDGQRIRRDASAEVVADVVVGAYEAFSRRMVDMRERPDIDGWVRSFLAVLYEGLVPRAAPARRPAAGTARRPAARGAL